MSSSVRSHRDLLVWQKAIDFVVQIYQLTSSYPSDERFGLTSQIRRASVSIPSNIAEGAARRSKKEFSQFVSIALGSAAEVETQLEIASRLTLVSESAAVHSEVRELIRMLIGLRQSLNAD